MAKVPSLSVWTQQSNYGGFSDDKFLGIRESFAYAKGIEIRKNPYSITLAKKPIKEEFTFDSLINKMVTISTTSDIIAFGANGKIWRNTGSLGTWTHVYTDSANRSIMNAIEYNGKLLWATSGYLHYIELSNIDNDWTGISGVTENFATFTNGNLNAHPMMEIFGNLFIGDGNLMAKLDTFDVFTADALTIAPQEEIRVLSYAGAVIRVYSRKTNRINYGCCYLWDGASAVYQERIGWEGLVIHAAVNRDGIDYVVAGVKPTLFASTGYKRSPLLRFPSFSGSYKGWVNPNAIDIHDNNVVVGMADVNTTAPIGRGVWTYGQETMNYPNSLNFEYPTSNDNTTDVIGCVHDSNGVLYYSWKDGSSYGIDKVSETVYRQTGELHSRVLTGALPSNWKHIQEAAIAFAGLLSGQKIDLYLRKNLETDWSTPVLTADYNDLDDRANYYKAVNDPFDDGDFHYLQTKVVLTTGSSATNTPELLQVSVVYDETIDKDQGYES